MKTILLILIGLSVTLGMSFAYAVPQLDYDQAFEYSDLVFTGKILSVEIISEPIIGENRSDSGIAIYEIEIIESKKNPENLKTITVPGEFLREPHGMSYDTYPYEVGQVGIFYIQKNVHGYADSELIVRSGVSKLIEPPNPPCKSGPAPDGDWKFIDCEWVESDIKLENDMCGSGTQLVDNICEPIRTTLVKTIGSDASPVMYLGPLILLFIIVGVAAFLIKRREVN